MTRGPLPAGGISDEGAISCIINIVRRRLGVELDGKRTLVRQRLQPMLWNRGVRDLNQLCSMLQGSAGHGEMMLDLLHRVTTHHTYFFRDADQLRVVVSDALAAKGEFRVWCAACSTGEEPYTLAMMLADGLGPAHFESKVSILATDISQHAIDHAERAVYAQALHDQIPTRLREKFTIPGAAGTFTVVEAVRRRCLFRRLNLQLPIYPFRRTFDWIVCRNVFFYFEGETRNVVASKLATVARNGTGLLLGLTESLPACSREWAPAGPHVYRRRG